MENLTFEQLPQAIGQLFDKLNQIENLLLQRAEGQKNEDEIFTVGQAAEFLNLSVATVYSKVCRKEVPVNKQGKRLYFYKSELTAWIKAGKMKTLVELDADAALFIRKRNGRRF